MNQPVNDNFWDKSTPPDFSDPIDPKVDQRIARDIVTLLEGLPLGIAKYILEQAMVLMLDCHTVDLKNPRCINKFAEIEEFLSGTGQ